MHWFGVNKIVDASGTLPAAARALNSFACHDRQSIRLLAFRAAECHCDLC